LDNGADRDSQMKWLLSDKKVPSEAFLGDHCLHPDFLEAQVVTSRKNLGLQTLDLVYLHNPEQHFSSMAPSEAMKVLEVLARNSKREPSRKWSSCEPTKR
jgi:aryl-alcohol dehydrogenase-like predicted oxidoreductase